MMQTTARHEQTSNAKIDRPKRKQAREKRRRIAREMPQRRCLASAESFPKDQLLRFVVSPDLKVVPDFSANLPGRGFYVKPERGLLKTAVKKRLFARAASQSAKQQVSVDADFDMQVLEQAKWHALQRLGLMRRSGALVYGLEKCQTALTKGKAGLYMPAINSDSPEIQKLTNLLDNNHKAFRLFTAEEQGEALGRDRLVHIIALQGQQCQALAKALTIVQQLSSDDHLAQAQVLRGDQMDPEARTELEDV